MVFSLKLSSDCCRLEAFSQWWQFVDVRFAFRFPAFPRFEAFSALHNLRALDRFSYIVLQQIYFKGGSIQFQLILSSFGMKIHFDDGHYLHSGLCIFHLCIPFRNNSCCLSKIIKKYFET